MVLNSEKDIEILVRNDAWMMDVLAAAEDLDLPDWWIGAGFLRNKIWDTIEGNPSAHARDVDLVYFDHKHVEPEVDWRYDDRMRQEYPFAEWEIRNQARMHDKNGLPPFSSTEDGISNWVETATCIAVKKKAGKLAFLWCYGLDDVLGLVARPIPRYVEPDLLPVFERRIAEKRWLERWPRLRINK
jgi:hypothetical protein